MLLGPQLWKEHELFYNGLILAAHGDDLEKHAATSLGITRDFPSYELLWKRHVCPATTRPIGTDFRPGVAPLIAIVTQRCYSVLYNLVLAMESFAKVRTGESDRWNHNCYDTIIYAGNTLQVLTEFQYAVCGKWENGKKKGTEDLLTHLGVSSNPFEDWAANWADDRESATNYRHYLTHQGHFYTMHDATSGKTLVLKRDKFTNRKPFPWPRAEASYKSNPNDWQLLDSACEEILEHTVRFLDRTYARLLTTLDDQLSRVEYQRLWGWQDHQAPAAVTPTVRVVATGSINQRNMSASTSLGITGELQEF